MANQSFNSVACGDGYTDAATISQVFGSGGGAFEIQDQPAFYKLQYGGQGSDTWTDEQQLGAGGGTIPPGVTGIAFRNASNGVVATVSAYIIPAAQPHLALSFPSPTSGNVVLVPTVTLAAFPPTAPADGQLITLILPATFDPIGGKTIRWLLEFNATESVWDFMGGPALYSEVQTSESPAATGLYVALATPGPSITVPRLMDAQTEIGAFINDANSTALMSYDIGGTGAVDADAVQVLPPTAGGAAIGASVSRPREKVNLPALSVLTAKYKTVGAGQQVASRWMRLTPVRLT